MALSPPPIVNVIDLTARLGLYALGELGVTTTAESGRWPQIALGGVSVAPRLDWHRPAGIDALTVRTRAATREDLKANALDPKPATVTIITVPHGQSVTGDLVAQTLAAKRPKWAFMAHWETGSGRINDIRVFDI